jgi:hypothetical protein
MTVEDANRYDPGDFGYGWNDLGQCSGEGEKHTSSRLISELTEPLTQGRINTYVVFVPDQNINIDSYEWKVTKEGGSETDIGKSNYGTIRWRIPDPGNYAIKVTLKQGSGDQATTYETLGLSQKVQPKDDNIELLDQYVAGNVALCGELESMKRVLYDLKIHAEQAITQVGAGALCATPIRFLCSIIYSSITIGKSTEKLSECLYGKDNFPNNASFQVVKPVLDEYPYNPSVHRGVCRIAPEIAAEHFGLITLIDDETTLTPIARHLKLLKKYAGLADKTKLHMYNLLRFSKSNLRIAADLLVSFKQSWDNVEPGDHSLALPQNIRVLGEMFTSGGFYYSPINNDGKFISGKFGDAVESSYRIPALSVFVEPTEKTRNFISQWEANFDNDPTGEKRTFARMQFNARLVDYVLLRPFISAQLKEKFPELQDESANYLLWISDNIRTVKPEQIFDGNVIIHSKIVPFLESLSVQGYFAKDIGGFCPRMISGSNYLSNHAAGLALDFDSGSNPILYRKQLDGINELFRLIGQEEGTCFDEIGETSTYEQMHKANDDFMTCMARLKTIYDQLSSTNPDIKMNPLTPEHAAHYPKLNAVYNELKIYYGRGGIMTLPEKLITAMKNTFASDKPHCFSWGGNWINKRDSMHFDLKDVELP